MLNSFNYRKEQGFSLLEVLITVAITAIALVALAKFQGTLMQNNSLSKTRTTGITLAQDKLEELRGTTYASLVSGTEVLDTSTMPGLTEKYSRVWTVTKSGNNAAIAITVKWPDRTDPKGAVTNNTTITLNSSISDINPDWSGRAETGN